VAVSYATGNGTAVSGSDYQTANGVLTFNDGETQKSFQVTILDDSVYEGDETVLLALSNPTGGAALGSPVNAVLTISDPEDVSAGSLQFSQAAYSVQEDGATATIQVTRSGVTDGQVAVSYATGNGTAVSGSDYQTTNGVLTFDAGETQKSFQVTILDDNVYEGDETVTLSLSNPSGGATIGTPSEATLTITDEEDLREKLYFAQFGNGNNFVSQIFLMGLDESETTAARIIIKTDEGLPFDVFLNAQALVDGQLDTTIPPKGLRIFESDATGTPKAGSVTVCSDRPLAGVIIFSGGFGLAGVGSSLPTPVGFTGPVEVNANLKIRTGIAIQNLENEATTVDLELRSRNGTAIAVAQLPPISAMGQTAIFASGIDWGRELNFTNFQGTVTASVEGRVSATMIQTRPDQFATLPVAIMNAAIPPATSLNFAQFGNGTGFFSLINLLNLDAAKAAATTVTIKDNFGKPFPVSLNKEFRGDGVFNIEIPPEGSAFLQTDAQGTVTPGAVTVTSDNPLAGVIVFGGSFGLAGVGSSQAVENSFTGPVENQNLGSVRTGIAIQNLENKPVTVNLRLLGKDGTQKATASLPPLAARGHTSLFLTDIDWYPGVNLSSFQGTVVATATGRISAAMIQTRPNQFATLPVAVR
jgi:hypothetical protein